MFTRPAAPHENGNRRRAGYAALAERYGLDVIPNWHTSHVLTRGTRRHEVAGDSVVEEYPTTYWPGDGLGDQLEFALKYDGTNLAILARLFQEIAESEMLAYVRAKPTGKYVRRAWFLYELITGIRLPMDDLPARGSYVDLLEPDAYYTISPSRRVRRQRVNDNLLGNGDFCPTVRRTDTLRQQEDANLSQRCLDVVSGYPTPFLRRALGYLYEKETKSSFAIEHAETTPRGPSVSLPCCGRRRRRTFVGAMPWSACRTASWTRVSGKRTIASTRVTSASRWTCIGRSSTSSGRSRGP